MSNRTRKSVARVIPDQIEAEMSAEDFDPSEQRRVRLEAEALEGIRELVRNGDIPANLIRRKLSFRQAEIIINPHLMGLRLSLEDTAPE